MKRLEVSGAVRPLYESLGVKGLILANIRSAKLKSNLSHILKNILSYNNRIWKINSLTTYNLNF